MFYFSADGLLAYRPTTCLLATNGLSANCLPVNYLSSNILIAQPIFASCICRDMLPDQAGLSLEIFRFAGTVAGG